MDAMDNRHSSLRAASRDAVHMHRISIAGK
jgi:hypothetical protein